MEKKYLSIKQWAGKAEKLRIIFNLRPDLLSAELKYDHFFLEGDREIREVNYVMYFSHLTVKSHARGTDWRDVYDQMFKKLSEHRDNEITTATV